MTRVSKLAYLHVGFPSVSMSSIRFLENLIDYYKSNPDNINSDVSSDEAIKAIG